MILRGTRDNNSAGPSSGLSSSPAHSSSAGSSRGAEAATIPELTDISENGTPSKLEDHFGFLHSVSEGDQLRTL